MTQNELEAYDAMIASRDQWRERAERLERLYPSGAVPCSPSSDVRRCGEVTISRNGYIEQVERERDAALAKLAELEPLHIHKWHDGCRVIRCGEGEWRLEWCECGASREKAGSRKFIPENERGLATAPEKPESKE